MLPSPPSHHHHATADSGPDEDGTVRLLGPRVPCPRCDHSTLDASSYAYLLGLYLGDGHISAQRRGRFVLSISCDITYEGLIDAAMYAVARVHPGGAVWLHRRRGCADVQSSWNHWPCLFPQHGPGPKHQRPMVLESWQRETVKPHAVELARGLMHSDGCRSLNRVTHEVAGRPKEYRYPRWTFSNESGDILRICEWALDELGIQHRRNRPTSISVARRNSVAALDELIGAKY